MPDNDGMRLGSLILAGGRSKRMGQPKELLTFRGIPLLQSIASTLGRCTDPVLVVAREASQALPALPPGTVVVTDQQPGQGPLHGFVRGLEHLLQTQPFGPQDAVYLTGCDHAFVQPAVVAELARRLAAEPSLLAIAPQHDGWLEPLCAVYRLAVLPTAQDLLRRGRRSLQQLLAQVPHRALPATELRAIDPELQCLVDCNTPADWQRWRPDERR